MRNTPQNFFISVFLMNICFRVTVNLSSNLFQISKQAVNDYNRGRIYLKDLAARDSVPVFHTVEEAVVCAIEKCQSR